MNVKFRKIMSCVLMLALMVTLVSNASFTAFAAEVPGTLNLYINGGTKVTNSAQATSKLASGTATLAYDDVTKTVTLTLTDATIETNNSLGINFSNPYDSTIDNFDDNITFNLVLVGNNTITSTSTDREVNAIWVDSANLNISGAGNLNVSASTGEYYENYWNRTIFVSNGNLSFNGTGSINVSAKSEKNLSHLVAIYTTGNIDINSGVINAYVNRAENGDELNITSNNCAAIFIGANFRNINIENATVNAYAGKGDTASCGIGGDPGTVIEISNATVNAYGGTALDGCNSYGIGTSLYSYGNGTFYPDTYAVSIKNSNVTAVGGVSSSGNSYGIGSEASLEIIDSTVTATGGNAGNGSYGIGVGYTGNYGDIKISGNSNVEATSGTGANLSYGIGASGSLTISDSSTVKAYSGSVTTPAAPFNYSLGICSVGGITLSEANTLDLYGVHRAIGSVGGIRFTTISGANYKLLNDGTEISVNDIATTTLGQKLELIQYYNVNFTGTNVTSNGALTIVKGTDYVATLEPDENYKITSDNISVKINGVDVTGYTFDESTGVLTVPASLITGDIRVTVTAIRIPYPVSLISGENYTFSNTTTAQKGSDYTVTLTPSSNYKISASDISVTVGGTAVSGFTYNESTGVLTIPASLVTGEISISAQAKIKTFAVSLNSSTVTFSGADEATAGSDYTVAMTASANNILPENIIVKIGDSVITNYTYKNGGVTGRGTLTIPASVITDEITIIVESKIMSYLVTFVDFDGKTLKSETIEHGKDAVAPEAPVRTGYKFTGWDKETKNITADTIIKALYQQMSTGGSEAGVAEPEQTTEPTTTPTTEVAPESEGTHAEKTGDTTNVLMLFVMLFSGSAALFVLKFNERKKKVF